MIKVKVGRDEWKPIRVGRVGCLISHFLFAYDMLQFVEASMEQIDVIKECLQVFCDYSGQKVSVAKTKLFFS